jgi:hypothetical protein
MWWTLVVVLVLDSGKTVSVIPMGGFKDEAACVEAEIKYKAENPNKIIISDCVKAEDGLDDKHIPRAGQYR